MKNQPNNQGLGLEIGFSHVDKNQSCLPNEASAKTLDTKARMNILVWQCFMYILLHFSATGATCPIGRGSFAFGTLPPVPYVPYVCVSTLYAFAIVKHRTCSTFLSTVRKTIKCFSGYGNPQICGQPVWIEGGPGDSQTWELCRKSWVDLVVWKTVPLCWVWYNSG